MFIKPITFKAGDSGYYVSKVTTSQAIKIKKQWQLELQAAAQRLKFLPGAQDKETASALLNNYFGYWFALIQKVDCHILHREDNLQNPLLFFATRTDIDKNCKNEKILWVDIAIRNPGLEISKKYLSPFMLYSLIQKYGISRVVTEAYSHNIIAHGLGCTLQCQSNIGSNTFILKPGFLAQVQAGNFIALRNQGLTALQEILNNSA